MPGQPNAGGEIVTTHDVTELPPFEPADFAEEIGAAATNFQVGTDCQLETDRVRVWDFVLQPGYRHPFHCHRTNYSWICTAAGSAIQRLPDGQRSLQHFRVGEMDYLEASGSSPLIHDLESVGDTTLRFITIELLV